MTITKTKNGDALIIALEGRLDTTTAPELDAALRESLDGVTDLTLEMGGLAYLSSAGLRVLLSAQKQMNKQGKMVLKNVCQTIMDVFEVTGFSSILTIE